MSAPLLEAYARLTQASEGIREMFPNADAYDRFSRFVGGCYALYESLSNGSGGDVPQISRSLKRAIPGDGQLDAHAAAAYLGLSYAALNNRVSRGQGPKMVRERVGAGGHRMFYRRELDRYRMAEAKAGRPLGSRKPRTDKGVPQGPKKKTKAKAKKRATRKTQAPAARESG